MIKNFALKITERNLLVQDMDKSVDLKHINIIIHDKIY